MNKKTDNRMVMDALIMVFQFGINMIVPIFICTLLGVWIGDKTGATWVTVPLFFIGAIAGGNNIYKMSKRIMNSSSKGSKNVKKNK